MLAIFCGLALATETLTPAHPDATGAAPATPAEPAEDRKFLSAAVETPRSEVEVETPAAEKREEDQFKRQVMQIAEEVQSNLKSEDHATSGTGEKKEEMKHENLATAEAESSPAMSGEEKREVAQIAEEVQHALVHEEAAKQSSEEKAVALVAEPPAAEVAPAEDAPAK